MNARLDIERPEIALALCQVDSLDKFFALGSPPTLANSLDLLGCPSGMVNAEAQDWKVTHIHFGNEFCERLLPTPKEFKKAKALAEQQNLPFVFVTPMMTDTGIKQFEALLPEIPDNSQVVVNDWGTLQRLRVANSTLVPVLGRMMNKMIKDPRIPSPQWNQLHPHDSQPKHFQALLHRFDITQLEMDVPPFATPELFDTGIMGACVHLPYGYTVKGRMCRIGSLNQAPEAKFLTAHACQKECLNYWAKADRPEANLAVELHSFQRGNTQFYRHSDDMALALWEAVERGLVNRLIVAGDWHENHSPAE